MSFVQDYDELHCDECGKNIGYYYITDHLDSGFVCIECKPILEKKQKDEYEAILNESLSKELFRKECGDAGHDWYDVTSQVLRIGGDTYECKKCGDMYFDPHAFMEMKS